MPALVSARIIADKLRRALRNRTGVKLSLDQIQELFRLGVIEIVLKNEMEELCLVRTTSTESETIGSKSAAMENLPKSGKSPRQPAEPLSIAALSAGMN